VDDDCALGSFYMETRQSSSVGSLEWVAMASPQKVGLRVPVNGNPEQSTPYLPGSRDRPVIRRYQRSLHDNWLRYAQKLIRLYEPPPFYDRNGPCPTVTELAI